ncbi:MAG: T9SS type A sorting domain-containing protein [Bacteroidota bacterium]
MRQFLFILCFCFTSLLHAQLEDNSIAPNWTLTDIDGNQHELYEYLNAGKSVFLEFSATWSGNSWAYHNKGHLNKLYEDFGPSGTDEVMVIMIEGDLHTGIEELHGSGTNTYGNWLDNTLYPIIDDHSLNQSYRITRWPIVYVICPNKRIRSVGLEEAHNLYDHTQQCQNPWGQHNVSILSYDGDHKAFCRNKRLTPIISIQNEGTDTLRDCTIELAVNASSTETINWTGKLAPFQHKQVSFSEIELQRESMLSFRASSPNQQQDEYPQYNELSDIQIRSPKTNMEVRLYFHTDNWPEENAWSLEGPNGTIASSADYDSLEADTQYEYVFDLPTEGCYTFEMTDSYGNGLANGELWPGQRENGAISLESDNGVIWNNAGFGFGFHIPFEASDGFTTAEIYLDPAPTFEVFPNPTSNWLTISLDANNQEVKQLSLYNSLGQRVWVENSSFPAFNSQNLEIDCSEFPKGIYWLFLENASGKTAQQKIIVQ